MRDVQFEWDPRKAAVNLTKHRVSFKEAESAFHDPFGLVIADPDHSEEEDRYILLGVSVRLRVVGVVYSYRPRRGSSV